MSRWVSVTAVGAVFAAGIAGLALYQTRRTPGEDITVVTILWVGALAVCAMLLGVLVIRVRPADAPLTVSLGCGGSIGAAFLALPAAFVLANAVFEPGPSGCIDECHRWAVYGYAVVMVAAPLGAIVVAWVGTRSLRLGLGAGLVAGAVPWLGAAALAGLAFLGAI